jgi:choline dehydrogenase-like flavoprotein
MSDSHDVIVIGSGVRGGTLVRHLPPSGKRILLHERGAWLTRKPQNWLAEDVFVDGRYVSPDTWHYPDGSSFQPQVHDVVGGATKFDGRLCTACTKRTPASFAITTGISPAWPISYDAIAPYYTWKRLENESDRIVRDVIASLFEVGIDPMVVIRWKDVALDRGRHPEPRVLPLGRSAMSAERSTTDIAPDRDGGGLRFARNPGVRQVNARWPFRTAGQRSRSRRATACPPTRDRPRRQIISSG